MATASVAKAPKRPKRATSAVELPDAFTPVR